MNERNDTPCRFCGSTHTHTFIDLGLSPLANEYVSEAALEKGQYFYPLKVNVCEKCCLAQAMVFSRPEDIFSDYKYFSSYSQGWPDHCHAYVDMIVDKLQLTEKSNVVEIACNDGYLLQYFKPYGIPVYGVEPAENVAQTAREKGIEVVVDFFGDQLAPELV